VRFPHNTKIFRGQLEAAPFIGVFFLLVFFLLLQSTMVFTPGLPIQLPEGGDLPGTDNPTVAVAVDATGNFYFDNQLCDAERLKQRLRAAVENSREPLKLVVLAHKDARIDVTIRLGILARSVGIGVMHLAVRPPLVPRPQPPETEL
jgi:biopolymer transport protein ExbD